MEYVDINAFISLQDKWQVSQEYSVSIPVKSMCNGTSYGLVSGIALHTEDKM